MELFLKKWAGTIAQQELPLALDGQRIAMGTFGSGSGNRGWSFELGSARDDEFGSRRTVGSREALGQAWKKAQGKRAC